eukprot:2484836-Prymnesium_polylepis.1
MRDASRTDTQCRATHRYAVAVRSAGEDTGPHPHTSQAHNPDAHHFCDTDGSRGVKKKRKAKEGEG